MEYVSYGDEYNRIDRELRPHGGGMDNAERSSQIKNSIRGALKFNPYIFAAVCSTIFLLVTRPNFITKPRHDNPEKRKVDICRFIGADIVFTFLLSLGIYALFYRNK